MPGHKLVARFCYQYQKACPVCSVQTQRRQWSRSYLLSPLPQSKISKEPEKEAHSMINLFVPRVGPFMSHLSIYLFHCYQLSGAPTIYFATGKVMLRSYSIYHSGYFLVPQINHGFHSNANRQRRDFPQGN